MWGYQIFILLLMRSIKLPRVASLNILARMLVILYTTEALLQTWCVRSPWTLIISYQEFWCLLSWWVWFKKLFSSWECSQRWHPLLWCFKMCFGILDISWLCILYSSSFQHKCSLSLVLAPIMDYWNKELQIEKFLKTLNINM